MIEAAEDAFTAFLDLPLKFGMMCTYAHPEHWRLKLYWFFMLSNHIDAIIRNPGATSKDEISDALNLAVLPSDKLDFAQCLKWHLAGRLLNPVAGFENVCIELEHFVVHGLLARGYDRSLMYPIDELLDDYKVHELPGGRVVLRGREEGGGGGGEPELNDEDSDDDDNHSAPIRMVQIDGNTGFSSTVIYPPSPKKKEGNKALPRRHDSPLPSIDPRPQTDLVPFEIRYLSKSVWQPYCARVSVM